MKNYNFFGAKIAKSIFFNFFITKVSYFVSNPNDNFSEASFEVYYVSVSQKLAILEFSPQIFFILTSVTYETFWGQTISLTNLNEVSNFSRGCQLSYETLFVGSVSKLELPETTISHRVILDPPRLLNWPKSPHRLGLSDQKDLPVNGAKCYQTSYIYLWPCPCFLKFLLQRTLVTCY